MKTQKDTASDYAAYVGLDWADRSHQICCRVEGAAGEEQSNLPHEPNELHAWADGLRARFGGRPIAVAVEQTKGPLIYALSGHSHLVIYPINPAMLAKYRQAMTSASGTKNDPLDAALLCELVQGHRPWLRALPEESAEVRQLQMLVEARRGLVDQRTGLTNQLKAVLKSYFPQALELVGENLGGPLAGAFLQRWPSLAAVQKAKAETLRRFYHQQQVRSAALIEERLERVRTTTALTGDAAVLASAPLQLEVLLAQLKVVQAAIAKYDERIAELFAVQPDASLYADLPGAGPCLAPRLLVAFGSDRTRYSDVQQLQRYSGIAPVQKQSGRTRTTHWRWHCPKFLRQTFHEFAGCSIPGSLWAKAFYQLQIERGKTRHQALRALAFKWQRILFRCWQTRQPYDEKRYLQALCRTRSPLLARIPTDQLSAA
jgi:transposase